MKALSIRQPWAWLIAHGHKDVENREWRTPHRGWFLIHASKTCARSYYESACLMANHLGVSLPLYTDLPRGGLQGIAWLDDCVGQGTSPWACGPICFLLSQAKPLPFIPLAGQLGFFEVPLDYLHSVRHLLP